MQKFTPSLPFGFLALLLTDGSLLSQGFNQPGLTLVSTEGSLCFSARISTEPMADGQYILSIYSESGTFGCCEIRKNR